MPLKLQQTVLYREREKDSISALLGVSKVSSNCFCLRGTIKLENAFGPWGCEQESLNGGGDRSGHVCTGGFIIDYLKQQKSAPHKPAAPKRNPKPTRNILGYVPSSRTSKQADSRNIAAFQHLSSYEEYADYYRMSKTQHYEDLINPHHKHCSSLGITRMGPMQNKPNAKPARLLETFRINAHLLPSSAELSNQHHSQEITTRSQENYYSKPSQPPSLSLPLLSIKEMEIANPNLSQQAAPKKPQETANEMPLLPTLNTKDIVSSSEKLWVPNDAIYQKRNNSASMHHSRGYYINSKRPVYSQQTERNTFGMKLMCPSVHSPYTQGQGIRIHPKCCNHLIQAKVSEIQISVDATALRTNEYALGNQDLMLRQISRKRRFQQRQFQPLQSQGCEARLVSRARIFFGENSEDKGEIIPVEESKLPKLANTQEPCLQQEGRSQCVSLPAICGQASESGEKSLESTLDTTAGSSNITNLPPANASGKATDSYSKLGLKSPKKWEEEYLHKTPRSFIFSRQHMLFSMESVNKRLLENGIKKSSKKERGWLQPSRRARRMEGRHRSSLDNGEVEAPFGTVEKHDATISKCFRRSMERQKSKRSSKVIIGRTFCSNIPQTSSKITITLAATGKSYKDSTTHAGREANSEDELTYE